MDSLSSLDYPATGFSICYEYGLFKQKIIDGMQIEMPDNWLPGGEVWLVPRTDRTFRVRFGGHIREKWTDGRLEIIYDNCEEIEAVPYDMMMSGADSEAVSLLRLWKAKDIDNFNMNLFAEGEYSRALQSSVNADIICKVLYPADNHYDGKILRLTQQYFMVSASCQSIVRDHMAVYGTIDNLADKVCVHINDTHPALCVPEFMRILLDDYCLDWDHAWSIVSKMTSYTNHTVLPEALETWNEDLFRLRLPRIHQIVAEINERFCKEVWEAYPGNWNRISEMAILANGVVRMANLAIVGSHHINGVSEIHSNILKDITFRNFCRMWPEKFDNVQTVSLTAVGSLIPTPALQVFFPIASATDIRRTLLSLQTSESIRTIRLFLRDFPRSRRLTRKALQSIISRRQVSFLIQIPCSTFRSRDFMSISVSFSMP